MANQKLTDLTSASTPLSGSEQVYVVQSGNSRRATTQQLADVPGEWSGETVSQAEAEAGTATTRRAWTALRVFQAVAAWWAASAAKTKLDGIAAGATANATDAQLRDRASHTGTQSAGTITGLATVATSGSYADLTNKPTLGTAAALNVGTAAGNVVQLDGTGKLPAVDGSSLTGLPPGTTDLGYSASTRLLTSSTGADVTLPLATTSDAGLMASADKTKLDGIAAGAQVNVGTDLSYTASSRLLESSTGADVTLPLFATNSSNAGLVPGSSTGGTTNFLRADGTWAAPPGGSPGGSTTQLQFNDGGAFGGDADLTYNKTTNLLTTKGDISLDDGGSFTTTLQTITPTANRTISLPDATGTVALVAGSSGQIIYNNAGALGGTTATFDTTNGTRYILPFGYGTGAGGTVTQATNKSTGVTLNARCGQITMNAANLATNTAVSFTLTNSAIAATDVLILNHASGGTLGNYSFLARCAAGSATIAVRNVSAGDLAEAVVISFAVIKAVTA